MSSILALDIGGTKMEACLVDERLRLGDVLRKDTPVDDGPEAVITAIEELIMQSLANPCTGIGIALPGFVDNQGLIRFAGNILKDLVGINLKERIQRRWHLPVKIENDASCFALAEARLGAGRGYSHVLGVIWGSGIGSGLVVNGQLYRGAIGGAGELGHLPLHLPLESATVAAPFDTSLGGTETGPPTLETFASGYYLTQRYLQAGGTLLDPDPARLLQATEDTLAQQVMQEAIDYLAYGLAVATNLFNPNRIVLGGGVSQLPDPVYVQLNQKLKHFAIPLLAENLEVVRHQISASAGILGAAMLFAHS